MSFQTVNISPGFDEITESPPGDSGYKGNG